MSARVQHILVAILLVAPANGGSPIGPPVYPSDPVADPPWPPSNTKQFANAIVTTDTIPCSIIGSDILAAGGSAVDAAIAAGLCVGVVNHHNSGLGGGHFMTIYEKPTGSRTRELKCSISRETAPLAAHQDMYVNNTDASSKGGLSIAVPGEVKGFYSAWQRYGVLPWGDLFLPAIALCEDGFIVEKALSGAISEYESTIRADPNLSALFVKPDDTLITEGDTLFNPQLGATLTDISQDPDTFYNGTMADDIVADIQEYGGIITKEDLQSYTTKLKDCTTLPLSNNNLVVNSPPPPSSGVIYQFIMNILDNYMFNPADLADNAQKTLTYHRIVEANKFAYGKRSNLGDADFVNVTALMANLTDPAYGESIRQRINDTSTQPLEYYEPDFDVVEDKGTAHLSVQTRDGSAVAMTMTINLFFGSNVRGSRTAIMFNDEMDDFSTPGTTNSFGVPASPANYIVPGKMPMSSMCPSLTWDEDNDIVFSVGASGGTRITTSSSFVTMHSLWFGRDLQNATDTARVHHQLVPEELGHEPHMPQEVLDGFVSKNHVLELNNPIGNVNSIHNTCTAGSQPTDTCLHAATDGRKGGEPHGY